MVVKKILVVRNDRFGEFLLNIPAMRALKETFPEAKVIAVIDHKTRELAENISYIDGVIEWGTRKHSFREKLKLIRILKKIKFDAALMLNPSRDLNITTYLSGIPLRAGYDRKLGFLLNKRMKDKKYLGEKHEVEYNLELVGLVGAKTNDTTLSLKNNGKAIDIFSRLGIDISADFITIHPWTSDPVKQWPVENFVELSKRLAKELGKRVLVVGGKEEEARGLGYFSDLCNDISNITGKTSLMDLAAVLKKSRLLISGDSGPVHLASAVGTPVLAIFRNDLAGKTAKRWGPWGDGHSVIEKNNFSEITVDEVFNKAKEMLKL